MHEHRGMPLGSHDLVELPPVVCVATNGSGVDMPEQFTEGAGIEPFESILGSSKVGVALHSHPVPAGSKDHGHAGRDRQVGQLANGASRDEADNRVARDRVVEHTSVHDRRLGRTIGSGGDDHREPALLIPELASSIKRHDRFLDRR